MHENYWELSHLNTSCAVVINYVKISEIILNY